MCGINGAYFTDSSKEINRALFEASLNSIAHRGPDNSSSFISGGIALGHNRLSIIDLSSNSNQPFFSPDKKFAIVFNGELFNYKQLKDELEKSGEKFITTSDTEVLLCLLMRNGVSCLQKINGFFSFAFYDLQKHELLLVRDRFGEKPLFYSVGDEGKSLFFGSELKAVMPFIAEKKHSPVALKLLLHLSYIPAPYTIVEGVRKLEPGSYIRISSSNIESKKWYQHDFSNALIDSEEVCLRSIRQKFSDAVERRMVADVAVAGFLSGGIDSTLVSAFAKEIDPAYETFSLGFSENKFLDESDDAETAARNFGIHHNRIMLSENEMVENVFDLLKNADEPFGDSSMIALYSLCKKVKGKYKVILSGDGADEVFAGYNKHYALYKADKNSFSNSLIKSFGGIHALLPKSRNNKLANKARQLEKMHAVLKHSGFDRYWFLAGFNSMMADKMLPDNKEVKQVKEMLENTASSSDINRYLHYDLQLVLANDMLYKVDMASMLNGMEIRSPFMDHELIEYAFGIPGDLKMKNGTRKYLLKKAFADTLTPALINKPKHGFEVPLQQWLNAELRGEVEKLLGSGFINDQGIFVNEEIRKLVRKLRSNDPGDTASTVWTILNFQHVYLNYFNA